MMKEQDQQKNKHLKTVFYIFAVFVLSFFSSAKSQAELDHAEISRLRQLLNQQQIDSAVELAASIYSSDPQSPEALLMAGTLKFYQGDWRGAQDFLQRGLQIAPDAPLPKLQSDAPMPLQLLAQARAAGKIFARVKVYESEHFVLRSQPGRDSLLGLYAMQGLEAARQRLGPVFGFFPKRKVVVDILPDTKALAAITPLSEEAIKTSGTIALSKYGRLMVTSPRALMFGYDWQDTLCHEYIHLLITERSRNRVPVWLHEGLAKYFETLWRGEAGLALGPGQQRLLAQGLKKNRLITFAQMHPSMALLPSQTDTALAFAEVFTVIEYATKKYGIAFVDKVLGGLRSGQRLTDVFAAVTGRSFAQFERDWRKYLRRRAYLQMPGARARRLVFKQQGDRDDGELQPQKVKLPARAEKHRRLGGILRSAGHPKAAAIEYQRAVDLAKDKAVALYDVLAASLIEAAQYARAQQILHDALAAQPDDVQAHILQGRVAMAQKKWEAARAAYELANRVHPFHPEIHASLLAIARRTQDAVLEERETLALRALAAQPADGLGPNEVPGQARAWLSVETEPFARLLIDDEDQGLWTPLVDYPLAAGEHQLHLLNKLYGVDTLVDIKVKAGEHKKIERSLQVHSPTP